MSDLNNKGKSSENFKLIFSAILVVSGAARLVAFSKEAMLYLLTDIISTSVMLICIIFLISQFRALAARNVAWPLTAMVCALASIASTGFCVASYINYQEYFEPIANGSIKEGYATWRKIFEVFAIIVSFMEISGGIFSLFADKGESLIGSDALPQQARNTSHAHEDVIDAKHQTQDIPAPIQLLDRSRCSLEQEILKSERRADRNLLIGGAVASIGIGILTLVAFIEVEQGGKPNLYVVLPRIAIGVFVELMAAFFLRMYKSSLDQVRYYNNEMTNIDARASAMSLAIERGKEADVSQLLAKFADTERNFLIENGKSTVELRKMEIEQGSDDRRYKIFGDIIDKIIKIKV